MLLFIERAMSLPEKPNPKSSRMDLGKHKKRFSQPVPGTGGQAPVG